MSDEKKKLHRLTEDVEVQRAETVDYDIKFEITLAKNKRPEMKVTLGPDGRMSWSWVRQARQALRRLFRSALLKLRRNK